jgi:hypothetical protein
MFKIGHTKPIQEIGNLMTLSQAGAITSVNKNVTTSENVVIGITC